MAESWRTNINDYERDLLLPALKERMVGLKGYFEEVVKECESNMNNETFGSMIISITQQGVQAPRYVTAQTAPLEVANKFFRDVKNQCVAEFLEPINTLLESFNDNPNLKEFGAVLNKVNHICSIAIQSSDYLFMYRFNTFISLHEKKSGELKSVMPLEYEAITMPFKNITSNIVLLCKGTTDTIGSWHKEVMEWKTKTLELETSKLNRQNQLLTILVALVLSLLFFSLNDPYQKWQTDKFNQSLKDSQAELLISLDKERTSSKLKDARVRELEAQVQFKITK